MAFFAPSPRQENLYMAKLADQAHRYEDMLEFMDNVVSATPDTDELTAEERNLLCMAYKNVIGARRASWRTVSLKEREEEIRDNEDRVALLRHCRLKIESELSSMCNRFLKLLDSRLIPSAKSGGAAKVSYLKMIGDYHRYLAEIRTEGGVERKEAAETTLTAYNAAQDIANAELAPTHPVRLGLALNFSVFYYEILDSRIRACNLAKQAFDEAIGELNTLDKEEEEAYKDNTSILQLLRDNLSLWTDNR